MIITRPDKKHQTKKAKQQQQNKQQKQQTQAPQQPIQFCGMPCMYNADCGSKGHTGTSAGYQRTSTRNHTPPSGSPGTSPPATRRSPGEKAATGHHKRSIPKVWESGRGSPEKLQQLDDRTALDELETLFSMDVIQPVVLTDNDAATENVVDKMWSTLDTTVVYDWRYRNGQWGRRWRIVAKEFKTGSTDEHITSLQHLHVRQCGCSLYWHSPTT